MLKITIVINISRFHAEGEADRAFWQYEDNNILRDGNESIDSYTVGHDVPVEYDDRAYSGEGSLERLQGSPHSSTSRYRRRYLKLVSCTIFVVSMLA